MLRNGRELWWSLLASVLVTGLYAFVMFVTQKIPREEAVTYADAFHAFVNWIGAVR